MLSTDYKDNRILRTRQSYDDDDNNDDDDDDDDNDDDGDDDNDDGDEPAGPLRDSVHQDPGRQRPAEEGVHPQNARGI